MLRMQSLGGVARAAWAQTAQQGRRELSAAARPGVALAQQAKLQEVMDVDSSRDVAVDALSRIGESVVDMAGGVSTTPLGCHVTLDRATIEEGLGSSLEAVLHSGRNALRLSHQCSVRRASADELCVVVSVDEPSQAANFRAVNILTAELGLLSLLSKYAPAAEMTPATSYSFGANGGFVAGNANAEPFEGVVPENAMPFGGLVADSAEPFECPRLPVP